MMVSKDNEKMDCDLGGNGSSPPFAKYHMFSWSSGKSFDLGGMCLWLILVGFSLVYLGEFDFCCKRDIYLVY